MLSWILIAPLAGPCPAHAAPAAEIQPEILEAVALYDGGHPLAAAQRAEQLLPRDDFSAQDRRFLVQLVGAGYRDAYIEAPPGRADPAHLCAALRILDAYLVAPDADPEPQRLRDQISALLPTDPVSRCAPRTAVQPPAPPVAAPPPATAQPAVEATPAAPPSPPRDEIPPRQLQIAGGVVLGLGGALLGAAIYGLADQRRLNRSADDIAAAVADRPLSLQEFTDLEAVHARGIHRRNLAIGTGIAAAVMTAVGVALLVRGRRDARSKRWSLTPWLDPTGAGLTVRLR